MHLKTFGHPVLFGGDGQPVRGMRRKDLALLVYLCVEGAAVHPRGRLASLLWGDSPEERARHSLTQALGRLARTAPGALAVEKDVVRRGAAIPCDAVRLLCGSMEAGEVDDAFSLYAEPFLEGFDPGAGAEEFREWADRRRAELRNAALRLLERAGGDAAAAANWGRALRLAERAVQIDPVWEEGHRRLMRAQAARGERNRALRHYQAFEAWLYAEVGAEPDPETRALAEQLRAPDAPADPPAAPPPAPTPADIADGSVDVRHSPPSPAPPAQTRRRGVPGAVWLAAALLLAVLLGAGVRGCAGGGAEVPGHGEHLRLRRTGAAYLAFADTLYAYPDGATLDACAGRRPPAARPVRRLPELPRAWLPSVHRHPWMDGRLPVVSDHPVDKTAYVVAGCVLAGVPDPPTLDSIFGAGSLGRMREVEDSVLRRMPRAFIARGHPVRPAGTLIRAPDGRPRWITWHGGALAVPDSAVLATHCRTPREAVPVRDAEFLYYRPFATLQPGSGRCMVP